MRIEYLHASKYGNGAEVAEEFGQQMAAKGVTVQVHHIREARPNELPPADLHLFSSPARHPVKSALLAVAILVTGCLATACAQAASGAVIRDSPTASAPATAPPSVTPTAPTLTPTTVGPSTVITTITPTPASSSPAPSSGSGTDLIWLWVILGAVALLLIILWATRSPSRTPAPVPGPARSSATGWHARAADAYAQGAALDGAVRAAVREGAFIEPAGERWYEIRSLADDLAERLYAMRETAPDVERHAQVEHALRSLDAVRFAVDAENTITVEDEGVAQEANLHSSLLALESALNRLRTPESRYQ